MSARENAGAPLPRLDADVLAEVRALRAFAEAVRLASLDPLNWVEFGARVEKALAILDEEARR